MGETVDGIFIDPLNSTNIGLATCGCIIGTSSGMNGRSSCASLNFHYDGLLGGHKGPNGIFVRKATYIRTVNLQTNQFR